MSRYASVDNILQRAQVELGMKREEYPYTSTNDLTVQLIALLNSAGQELVELYPWQVLQRSFQKITEVGDTGFYQLPDDFCYMINQTGWERSNHVPLGGPLSPEMWTYLIGRDLVSQTIYASFRLVENELAIFPQPPPVGLSINFEYISRNWLHEATDTDDRFDSAKSGQDVILYEPILILKYLKVKHLEAKGFDASSMRLEFENMFNSRSGKDAGAAVLSASRCGRSFPYISPYLNTGDTGYGVP